MGSILRKHLFPIIPFTKEAMVTEHILTSLTRKRKIADVEVQDFALVDSSSEQTDFDFEEALEAHDRAEAARGGPVPAEDELPDPRTLHEDEASNEEAPFFFDAVGTKPKILPNDMPKKQCSVFRRARDLHARLQIAKSQMTSADCEQKLSPSEALLSKFIQKGEQLMHYPDRFPQYSNKFMISENKRVFHRLAAAVQEHGLVGINLHN